MINMNLGNGQPITVHLYQGTITDTIDVSIGDGPVHCLHNDTGSWATINIKARIDGGFVRMHPYDGDESKVSDTPWLESAPYLYRREMLDRNFKNCMQIIQRN